MLFSFYGSFFNYVDKVDRYVRGTRNVNGSQIFTYNRDGVASIMSTGGR